LACGIACPADSDQQCDALGVDIDGDLQRGDLVFWTGHVGLMVDEATIIHANAHHMATVYEPIRNAILRIAAQGDGDVTARKRL
jgi:cell wall-associated NlpC family hydrolase